MTGPLPLRASLISDPEQIARDPSKAAQFIAAMADRGAKSLIENASSRPMLMTCGDARFPVLVEDGTIGGTYVANPHSAYVLYARDEIDIIGLTGAARWGSMAALSVLNRWLRSVAINTCVHLDNWLLSTSLHGTWDGSGLVPMREALTKALPDHLPIIRCVDPWSSPDLFAAMRSDGWSMLPARQIWITDDLQRDWKPRSHVKSDRRAMRRSGLSVEELETVNTRDAERIVELYRQLYIGRYSSLNPAYTPAFVELTARLGVLRFRVARAENGMIMAVAGMRVAGDIVTVPMLGYDTTRPKEEALYRIASLLSSEWAMERGYRHHGSAGAGIFKSNRGAHSQIEYMAVYTGHLPRARRLGIKAFAEAAERVMVPTLEKQGW